MTSPIRPFPRKLDRKAGVIDLGHGAGGRATAQLIDEIIRPAFRNPLLDAGNDQALVPTPSGRLVMTTDSYVVSPLFFPGGCIGDLAVNGTVNDLAMGAARPLYLSCGLILEEGFPIADLVRIVDAMAAAADRAGVTIVTGDTKVVERGKGDGCFVNTTGLGQVLAAVDLPPSIDRARPGDAILVSGPIGDHGVAILSQREGLPLKTPVRTDSTALADLVAAMVAAVPDIKVLRDPTRGGLAAATNELAWGSGVGVELQEAAIPVRPAVDAACELLGLDPLNIANEGRLVAVCAPDHADRLLAAMRAHPDGVDAAVIGQVVEDERRFVRMVTPLGGTRMVDWLSGEQLPRIC